MTATHHARGAPPHEEQGPYCECGGVLSEGRWGDWTCDECERVYGPDEDQTEETR